jgi:plastocyanin
MHKFALRNNLGDTSTPVVGAYNNDTLNGIDANERIMFTPTELTPNTIYYQCPLHSGMSGTITIKDYTI